MLYEWHRPGQSKKHPWHDRSDTVRISARDKRIRLVFRAGFSRAHHHETGARTTHPRQTTQLVSKYNKDSAHAYWYAFIAICGYLGGRLPATHEIKLSYETDLINQYLLSDFGVEVEIEEVLLGGDQGFFGLPVVKDWPLCGLWSGEQLLFEQKRFAPIDITEEELERLAQEDDEKEMAYDSIRQIKNNIAHCLDKQLSLVSFCH